MLYLEATIDHHLNCCLEDHPDINPDIINKIRHSLYVDDLSSGAEKLKDRSKLSNQSLLIFKKGNMNLPKWKSNSNEFMIFIRNHEKGKKIEVLEEPSYVDLSLNPSLVDDTKVLEERYSNSQPSTQRSTLQIHGSVVFILTWIKTTDKKYKQFVENRVSEIRQNSNVKDWEYKQEKENIAGLAFRGCNLKTLKCTKKWFNGPEWLLHGKEK